MIPATTSELEKVIRAMSLEELGRWVEEIGHE